MKIYSVTYQMVNNFNSLIRISKLFFFIKIKSILRFKIHLIIQVITIRYLFDLKLN